MKNMNIVKYVNGAENIMMTQLSAEMILSTGSKTAAIESAIGTVEEVLCRPGDSKNVYAVVFREQHKKASDQPDHLSMMNAVISAAKKSWHEMTQKPTNLGHRARPVNARSIEIVERNGIRIYRGCASPKEFQRSFITEAGICIFPSHLNVNTIADLGLSPLSKEMRNTPIVIQVGMNNESTNKFDAQAVERESRNWRDLFVSQYRGLSATEVAEEAGNAAKNRSALASRWAKEGKIFGVRYRNQTLYPAFQFKDGEPIPAIAKILKEMPESFTSWDIAFFLTSPSSYLDDDLPINLLKTNPERVVPLARAFANPADGF